MSTTFSNASAFRLARPAAPDAGLHQLGSWRMPGALWRTVRLWTARQAQRAALVELLDSAHLLADIGLTREQALREAAKPFWRS
jgi:uncharacterized protein YjiS (DUF1127 family)